MWLDGSQQLADKVDINTENWNWRWIKSKLAACEFENLRSWPLGILFLRSKFKKALRNPAVLGDNALLMSLTNFILNIKILISPTPHLNPLISALHKKRMKKK